PSGFKQGNPEYRLFKYLFTNYSNSVRPVRNVSDIVPVSFDIGYSSIVNLHEKKQILISNLWVRLFTPPPLSNAPQIERDKRRLYTGYPSGPRPKDHSMAHFCLLLGSELIYSLAQQWYDPWLTWNESEFAGMQRLNVEPSLVWKPDIVLYNNVHSDSSGEMYLFTTKVLLYSSGKVRWLSPIQVQSECKIDITNFPLDDQQCKLEFGSWAYDGHQLNLTNARQTADLSMYTTNGEWEMLSGKAMRKISYFSCCKAPYLTLVYMFHLRRRALFYFMNLILPCVLLTFLSAITFRFPPESGERVSLTITILLGMTVFMLIFIDNIPPTSLVVPLIGRYFSCSVVIMAATLVATCVSLSFYYSKPSDQIPIWLRILTFKCLGPALSVRPPKHLMPGNDLRVPKERRKSNKGLFLNEANDRRRRLNQHQNSTIRKLENTSMLSQSTSFPNNLDKVHQPVIRVFLDSEAARFPSEQPPKNRPCCCCCRAGETPEEVELEEKREEWHYVAAVVDRAFFYLFLIIILPPLLGCTDIHWLFCCFLSLLGVIKANVTRYEKLLYEDLFRDYNKEIRPVLKESDPVEAQFGFALSEILDLSEKNQVLSTNVWIRQTLKILLYRHIQRWKDPSLVWNSSNYGNIKSININPENIWTPDIVLYNNVNFEDNGEQYLFKTKVVISSDGTVTWLSPNKLRSFCKINIQYFPFDTQYCVIMFGSWTFDGLKLNLGFYQNYSAADLSKFSKNGEFELISADAKRNVIKYTCCPAPYVDLTYTIKIKRRPLFYMNNLILPCIVLALLTSVSFMFPPETGERISLVITVLLGMTVFMIVFTEAIPATSEVTPLIGRYFAAVLFEVALCLLATCVPLRLQHLKPGTEMPHWARVLIFDFLGPVMCYGCSKRKRKSSVDPVMSRDQNYEHNNGGIRLSSAEILENGYIRENGTLNKTLNENHKRSALESTATTDETQAAQTSSNDSDDYLRLLRDITRNHELVREIVPVEDRNTPVNITLDIAYSQLVEMDSKNQILSSYIWVRQYWTNPRLRWDPMKYGGVSTIHVDPTLVWLPDIVLYNNSNNYPCFLLSPSINGDNIGQMYKFDTKVILNSDGNIQWFAPTLVKSMCKIDITYFPFDRQNCKLKFGSWIFTTQFLLLQVQSGEPDLSKYSPNGEWDLIKMTRSRNLVKYSCCKYPYVDVTYHIYLKRRALFYVQNLIIPCVMLATLSVLSFTLPPGSGERIAMMITLLLGLTVYMLIFTENIPKTSEVVPLINRFFVAILFENSLCLLATSLSLQLYHYHDPEQELPAWLQVFIFDFLAKLLRMKMVEKPQFSKDSSRTVGSESPIINRIHPKCKLCSIAATGSMYRVSNPRMDLTEDKLNNIHVKLNELHKLLSSSRNEERWHFAAMVLDRFFCIAFAIVIFASLLTFYFMIPGE
ncbi:hypothetical protein QZH41_015939, partial [Actinostola sp. cb2023]